MTTQPITPSYPLNCQVAAKEQVVELIMARYGRFQPDPLRLRRTLMSDSFENLKAFYAKVVSGEVEP